MPYIGRDTDKISNVEVLDNITFDGSSSYTLQKNSVNFTPSSANTLLLSIDGVVQAGNFTVSGSTIDFGTAVAGTSTCDFVLHYGVGLITTPADGTVTAAKLNNDIISGSTELASEPADTDEFLVSDAGTLKRIDYSLIKGGGITMAQQWRLTTSFTGSATPIASNWEVADTDGYGGIGSSMSESSGIFTFPSTGIYKIHFGAFHQLDGDDRAIGAEIHTTTNNSSYSYASQGVTFIQQTSGSVTYASSSSEFLFDVTDTSTHKCRFVISAVNSSTQTNGNSTANLTYVTFTRLGDT